MFVVICEFPIPISVVYSNTGVIIVEFDLIVELPITVDAKIDDPTVVEFITSMFVNIVEPVAVENVKNSLCIEFELESNTVSVDPSAVVKCRFLTLISNNTIDEPVSVDIKILFIFALVAINDDVCSVD